MVALAKPEDQGLLAAITDDQSALLRSDMMKKTSLTVGDITVTWGALSEGDCVVIIDGTTSSSILLNPFAGDTNFLYKKK